MIKKISDLFTNKTLPLLSVTDLVKAVPYIPKEVVVKGAIVHQLTDTDPSFAKALLAKKAWYVHFVDELTSFVGKPKYSLSEKTSYIMNELSAGDHKLVKDTNKTTISPSAILSHRYDMLDSLYIYKKSRHSHIDRYHNRLLTMISAIASHNSRDIKTQIIVLNNVPFRNWSDKDVLRVISDKNLLQKRVKSFDQYTFLQLIAYCASQPSVFDGVPENILNTLFVSIESVEGSALYPFGLFHLMVKNNHEEEHDNMGSQAFYKRVTPVKSQQAVNLMIEMSVMVDIQMAPTQGVAISNKGIPAAAEDTNIEDILEEEDIVTVEDIEELSVDEEHFIKDVVVEESMVDNNWNERIIKMKKRGDISTSKVNKYAKDIAKSKELLMPGSNIKLSELTISDTDALVVAEQIIPDDVFIIEPSMRQSVIEEYDKVNARNINTYIALMIRHFENTGVFLRDYKVTTDENITGIYDNHKIELAPIGGKKSTTNIPIPRISDDGTLINNKVEYILKKQKSDFPIAKINYKNVVLSSNFGKLLLAKDERLANSYSRSLDRVIKKRNMDPEVEISIVSIPSLTNDLKIPYTLAGLMTGFSYIKYKGYEFKFTELKSSGKNFIIGKKGSNDIIIQPDDTLLVGDKEVGHILDVLDIDQTSLPRDTALVRIFGAKVPLGIFMCYLLGLPGLLKYLKADVSIVPSSTRKVISNDITMTFKDVRVVVKNPTHVQSMILAGFSKYEKALKVLEYGYFKENFERAEGLFMITSSSLVATTYTFNNSIFKEMKYIYEMFIDPITEKVLEKTGEPTKFQPLLIRAVELLVASNVPEIGIRIRGGERIAGFVYQELIRAVRVFKNSPPTGNHKINMSTFAVARAISGDETVEPISMSNPQDALKGKNAVTLTGAGGRNKATIVKKAKEFKATHVGLISESSSDSGDVAIITNLTANPTLDSVYGIHTPVKDIKDNPISAVSGALALYPTLDRDDPKRIKFASIHDAHMMGIEGGETTYIYTGYGSALVRKKLSGNKFSSTASGDGKVTDIKKDALTITYADGLQEYHKLGSKFGAGGAKNFEYMLITALKVGDKVSKGTVVTYNPKFFKRDKWGNDYDTSNSRNVNVALMEMNHTWEDGSTQSSKLAKQMTVEMVYPKTVIIDFSSRVYELANVGDSIKAGDAFVVVENDIGVKDELTDRSFDILKELGSDKPLSKYEGEIASIDVLYHGSKEDMSPDVLDIVNKYDRVLARERKVNNQTKVTGQIDFNYTLKGKPIPVNKVIITINLRSKVGVIPGDKMELMYSSKTVISNVFDYTLEDDNGREVDVEFAYIAKIDRAVNSPLAIGTGSVLCREFPKLLKEAWDS